ncbi:MAG: transcriptional repressor [Sulfurovum sp.]|nr:transcriptional repressor [Sulfurovum sp.]
MKIDDIKNIKNLRFTDARIELLEILIKESRPICYEDIKNRIKMNKATFYRNIAKFVEGDIVSTFESNDKKSYFEIKVDTHPHFICNNCHAITCVSILNSIVLEGYAIDSVILKGTCKLCL